MSIELSYGKRNFIFLKGQSCWTSSVPKRKKINLGLIQCRNFSNMPLLNKQQITNVTNTEPNHEKFKLSVGSLPLKPNHRKTLSKYNSETNEKNKIQIQRNEIHKKALSEEREPISSFSSKNLLKTERNKNIKEKFNNKIILSPAIKENNRILYVNNKINKKNKISLVNEDKFSERVGSVVSLKKVYPKINNDSCVFLDKNENNISTKEASCTSTLKMKSLITKANNKLINNPQEDSFIYKINKLESPEDIHFLIVKLIHQGKIIASKFES